MFLYFHLVRCYEMSYHKDGVRESHDKGFDTVYRVYI